MKHFFWVLFFIISFYSYSQEVSYDFKNEPLKLVLIQLEDKFGLRFSYQDAIIENQKFSFTGKNTSLQIILNKIQQRAGLVFEKVNDRYYIIRKRQQHDNYRTICAYVFNKNTQETLDKAEIININQGTGVTTNKKGYFELYNIQETDTISIHYLGFKTTKITAKEFTQGDCKKIDLSISNEELEEVIIKEYITQGILQNNNGSIQVVPDKLKILPGLTEPDVLESLQTLPGIQSPNETASGLHIRGGTPDQNLILWDGIKVYHSGHFFGIISAFNPYITNNITVYKNGSKPKYGNRISGVIDINSQNNIPQKTKGGFGFNMTHADAYLKFPMFNKKVGIITSFRRSITDVLNTFTFKNLSKKVFQNTRINQTSNQLGAITNETTNNFYFKDFNIKAIADISKKDKLIISSLIVENKLNYAARFQDFNDATNDNLKINNFGFKALWNKSWNDKLKQEISINTSNYKLDYLGTNMFEGIGNTTITKKNSVNELELETAFNFKFSNKSFLEVGYQYAKNNTSFIISNRSTINQNENFSFDDDGTNTRNAFFAEYIYNNTRKFRLSAGIRANNFSISNNFFIEPRLQLKWHLNAATQLMVSGELRNQAISQVIEFATQDFGLENQIWVLFNKNVFPILKSKQINGGLSINKNNWNINLETYYKKIDGLSSITRGFSNSVIDFSTGNNTAYGLDLLIKKKIGNYRTWMSYSLAKSNFNFIGLNNNTVFPGNFDIRHSFNWAHTLELQNFNFSLGWKFRNGKPFTNAIGLINTDQINYNTSINSSNLPSYHRLDFSATYNFNFSKTNSWKGVVGLSFLNLYNRKNILNKTYQVIVSNNGKPNLIENNQLSLGFTPNIVFRVNF